MHDETLPPTTAMFHWWNGLRQAFAAHRRPIDVPLNMRQLLEEAGFVEILEKRVKVWCHGRGDKFERGNDYHSFLLSGTLHGMTMQPFTRYLGYSPDQAVELVQRIEAEYRDTSNKLFNYMCVIRQSFSLHALTVISDISGRHGNRLPEKLGVFDDRMVIGSSHPI